MARNDPTIDERIARLIMEVDIRVEDLQNSLLKISDINKERQALEDRKTEGASGGEKA
jgi:hypothetical protein